MNDFKKFKQNKFKNLYEQINYKIWANTYEEAVKHLDVIESF
jgi:outer membrane protein assembly factor BamD (BamD/ComL family)